MTNHVKVYGKNTKGRDFFVSDIHGHFDLLLEEMKNHAFNTKTDRLFVGGDNCDRGPNSDWVLDFINEPWYISIRGNHEEMVIAFIEAEATGDNEEIAPVYRLLYGNGGEWFFDLPSSHQMRIYESFKSLPLAIELETRSGKRVGIVHAEVPYGDWERFKGMTQEELEYNGYAVAQWARTKYDRQNQDFVKNIDVVLSGHTPTKSGDLELLGNQVYCDLGSFFRNKICFIEITDEFITGIENGKI